MAEKIIYGNTNSVKKSIIEYLESFLENVYSPGSFLPEEIMQVLKSVTAEINREVAVYLDRKNRVIAIAVGDDSTVELPEVNGRRKINNLSGIRLIHTHPGGNPNPSGVDINTLTMLRLDAMVAVGVKCDPPSYITGASVTMLKRDQEHMLTQTALMGVYPPSQFHRFDVLFKELEQIDKEAQAFTYDIKERPERTILVSVVPEKYKGTDFEAVAELKELAESAGGEVIGYYVQRRPYPDPKYYIGSGLAREISLRRQALDGDLVIFDDELSPSQIKNLEDMIGARVIDRTALILDIFASRAKTKEGRLQVELAQQKYRLPRLTGQGKALSRLGGGIGTRGPGETKLESDRRHIHRRIIYLEQQLKEVSSRRQVLRTERKKKQLPTVAVVGYTNAGKSTLVNAMCGSDVFVENKVFATLDTSVRKISDKEGLNQGCKDILLVDTVGFIRKLPHDLVEAFKSTLEETVVADLLLHVVDASQADYEEMIEVVEEILREIGAGDRPAYLVLNKTDLVEGGLPGVKPAIRDRYGKVFYTSSTQALGLDALSEEVSKYFTRVDKKFHIKLYYSQAAEGIGKAVAFIHQNCKVDEEIYEAEYVEIKGSIPQELYGKLEAVTGK